jgi:uncharacterized membrane protein required for colicin V production
VNENDLKNISDSLSKYVLEYQKILSEKLNSEMDARINLLFIMIICKNIDSINAISKLITSSKFSHIIYSVAAILRGNSLNGMIALFLANKILPEKQDPDQVDIIEEIEKLYTDQVKHLINDIRLLVENKKEVQKQNIVDYINNEYQYFLERPILNIEDKLALKHKKSNFGTRKLIQNSYSKDQSVRFLESYIYYSKFDHIGIVTSKFYSKALQNINDEISIMLDSIVNSVYINDNFKSHLKLTEEESNKIEEITKTLYKELNYEY